MKKRAFLFGINEYNAPIAKLSFARQDAKAVAQALIDGYDFRENEVVLVTCDSNFKPTTKFDMLDSLNWTEELDLLIVGFWGHGVWRDGKLYLCPIGTNLNFLPETAPTLDELREAISHIPAKNVCLILDCCQNRLEVGKDSAAPTFDAHARDIVLNCASVVASGQTIAVLNACSEGQRAYEWDEKGHGYFTVHLLEELEKREANVATMFRYVQEETKKSTGNRQSPFFECRGSSEIILPAVSEMPGDVKDVKIATDHKIGETNATMPRLDPPQSARKKWLIPGILAVAILLGILWVVMSNTGTKENEITVPNDVPTLAKAYAAIPEDGTIFLKRGVHEVPKTITIKKNVTIIGDVEHPEYVVVQGGEKNVFHLQSGFAEIAGLTIQNEGKERPEDIPEDEKPAFATRYSAFVVSAPLCAIHDCVFVSRHCCGFIVNTKGSNPDVKNCTARNCGLTGFKIGSGASGTFTNCTASGNTKAGMAVCDAQSNPTVEGCQFTDGKSVGIAIYSGASGTFRNCTASGNAYAGMQVCDAQSNPTVEDCQFTNGKQWGILVNAGASGTFRNCTASGNALSGMVVRNAQSNPMVEGCQFTYGKGPGIFVCDGASGTFRNCTASRNAYSGMQVRDAQSNPTVEDCQFTDGKESGIFVHSGASGTFTNCTASGNTLSGMQVQDAQSNPTVEGCTFEKNQGSGVYVYKGASGTFRRNKLSGNVWQGKIENWDVSGAASDLVREGNTPNE